MKVNSMGPIQVRRSMGKTTNSFRSLRFVQLRHAVQCPSMLSEVQIIYGWLFVATEASEDALHEKLDEWR